jgi:hypothetical protein
MLAITIVVDLVIATVLVLAGYFQYTGAQDFCQRMMTQGEKVRQPWRSLFYSRWLYGSGRYIRSARVVGIVAILMGVFMFALAMITLFSDRG